MKQLYSEFKEIEIRLLQPQDEEQLFNYLQQLSPESKSRFDPHSFERNTIHEICSNLNDDCLRYIAFHSTSGNIIAYMLFKKGMMEWDARRLAEINLHFNDDTTVTFAPSVADEWQSSGLGTSMYLQIEDALRVKGIKHIVLWGGVQAGNEKAVNFYKKLHYSYVSSFWHEGIENLNMMKKIMSVKA